MKYPCSWDRFATFMKMHEANFRLFGSVDTDSGEPLMWHSRSGLAFVNKE